MILALLFFTILFLAPVLFLAPKLYFSLFNKETKAMKWISSGKKELTLVDGKRKIKLLRIDQNDKDYSSIEQSDKNYSIMGQDNKNYGSIVNDKHYSIVSKTKTKLKKPNKYLISDPFIAVIENFLAPSECKMLMELRNDLRKYFSPSKDLQNSYTGEIDSLNTTSYSLDLINNYGEPNLSFLKKRVSYFLYSNYHASMKEYNGKRSSKIGIAQHIDRSYYTLIVYLNDVSKNSGGATNFPKLEIKVQPERGMAIWFRNVIHNCGYCSKTQPPIEYMDPRMIHEGEPLLEGDKVILQFLSTPID